VDPKLIHKHSKLYYKAMYLNADLEETNAIFEHCKKEFFAEVSKHKKKPAGISLARATANLEEDLGNIFDEKNNKADSSSLKTLYRKIMFKAHPDKLTLLEDDDIKNMYADICSKAMTAMETESWYLLYEAATELGIKDIEIKDEHIKILEDNCKKLESETSEIKNTIPWIWFHYDDEVKEKCLKEYLKM
jgi:hypothetical protein